jgi:hypothetical protein
MNTINSPVNEPEKRRPGASAKERLFTEILGSLKESSPYFTHKAIQTAIYDAELGLKDEVLNVYLHQAVKQGIIHDAGRGWYSRLSESVKLDVQHVAKLVKTVEKAFPLLDFTVWSTAQVQSYGHHLLGKFVSFIHTERDAMDSVAESLRNAGWDVAANPRGKAAKEFTIRSERTVVIRPRTTTQPSQGHHVTPEGLLVELFIEARALNLLDAGEYEKLLLNLASTQRLQMAALLDYARERRPVGAELVELINADYLKTSALVNSSPKP